MSNILCNMTGNGAKPRLNTKVFKKVFSFKQKQPAHPSGESSAPADTTPAKTSSSGEYGASLSDDETSTCSSTVDTEGVLIFPLAQRLTASSPPAAVLDRVAGVPWSKGDPKPPRGEGFLTFGRRRRLSSSPRTRTRSPYQSKKTRKNLPASLSFARCHTSNNGVDPRSAFLSYHSPRERRQRFLASVSTRSVDLTFSTSKGSGIIEERPDVGDSTDAGIHFVQTASSNSSILPPEVSPALRFVPIGCEEDNDDSSIGSVDGDDPSTAAATVATGEPSTPDAHRTTSAPSATKPLATTVAPAAGAARQETDAGPASRPDGGSPDDPGPCMAGASRCASGAGSDHPPPSLAPTEDTASWESPGPFVGTWGAAERVPNMDSYCASLEEHQVEDWFPTIRREMFPTLRQEMMKLSMMFTSNCGVDSVDTI